MALKDWKQLGNSQTQKSWTNNNSDKKIIVLQTAGAHLLPKSEQWNGILMKTNSRSGRYVFTRKSKTKAIKWAKDYMKVATK